ncbi:MAG: hypothetical protein PUP92_23970 [Rhizonema sp. PD38]|nr:hypothetical protein [Rhizonema sp. PD38]
MTTISSNPATTRTKLVGESTLSDRLCTKNQLIQNTTYNPYPNTVDMWTAEALESDRRAIEVEERSDYLRMAYSCI